MINKKYDDNLPLLLNYHETKDIRIRNRIVVNNMGLVYEVAHKMAYCCDLPLDDLIQIGSTGLIRAIERFDPEKKCKLSSIAVLFINGAILQFIRDKGRLVKVPRTLQETHQKIKRYTQKHGVTYEQAALALGISLDLAKECATACNQITDELPDALTGEQQEELDRITPLIDKLPELQRVIINGLYINKIPVGELGRLHGMGIRKIREIETEALEQLRLIANNRVKCPKCQSYHTVKRGLRYSCKNCKYWFRVNPKPVGNVGHDTELKIKVIEAIESGKSLQWCELFLGIDTTTACKWRKKYAIDKEINLLINRHMAFTEQWQLTAKFTDLANFLIKNTADSSQREEALEALNVALLKSQAACTVKVPVKTIGK
ncbi:MAG: sigma-70 family RNA polymerase sigma factor [Dolichospermum sp.]